jgi:hypothetical protein
MRQAIIPNHLGFLCRRRGGNVSHRERYDVFSYSMLLHFVSTLFFTTLKGRDKEQKKKLIIKNATIKLGTPEKRVR